MSVSQEKDNQKPNNFVRIFRLLIGDRNRFEFEHRVFNSYTLLGFLAATGNVLLLLELELPLYIKILAFHAALMFAGFYFVSRFRHFYNPLRWPALCLTALFLILGWRDSGGSYGATVYFLFTGGAVSITLFRETKKRIAAALLYLLVIAFLLMEEFYFPELHPAHKSRTERHIHMFGGAVIGFIIIATFVILLAENFTDSFRKLQEYKSAFLKDLELARLLQERILGIESSTIQGYDLHRIYMPSAELSGDLFDIARLPDDRLRIFLADVQGHGIHASLSSMLVKSEWLNLNREVLNPAESLMRLNQLAIERYGGTLMFTCVIADIHKDRIVFSAGGHFPQYLRRNGEILELKSTGPGLGMFPDSVYRDNSISLSPGDTFQLTLFTDALIEEFTPGGKQIGHEWLKTLAGRDFASSGEFCDAALKKLALQLGQKTGSLSCKDDLTLIAFQGRS